MSAELILPEKFREIVAKTEAVVLSTLQERDSHIVRLNYDYGSAITILKKLVEANRVQEYQDQKYPLVAILDRLSLEKGKVSGFAGIWRPRIIIVNQALPDADDETRYETNITPILAVIYEELIKQIARSRYFSAGPVSKLVHKQDILPFWGKDGLYGNLAHIGTDDLDCIQIRDLELKVRKRLFICST